MPLSEVDAIINSETELFFNIITHPNILEAIYPLEKLKESTNNHHLQFLRNLLFEKNLECFKLIGKKNTNPWEVYYVDLEIPILFFPVLTDKISLEKFQRFSSIVKTIKTNLLTIYNQEIESLFIWLKQDSEQGMITSYTFKLEDQDSKPPIKRSRVLNDRKIILDTFLDSETIETKHELKQRNDINKTVATIEITPSESETIHLQNAKKRMPFGQRSAKNRLNLLTGREWVKFSKTWFIHRPPSRKKEEFLHPAKFPETLIRQFVSFFTKPSELVLDPFLGCGSTLIAAKQSNRSGVGIELSPEYAEISKRRLDNTPIEAYPPLYQTDESSYWRVICGDSQNLLNFWEEFDLSPVDFCVTSPPYWNQLERNTIRHKFRKELGLDTKYSEDDPRDIGNLRDYDEFLNEQKRILGYVHELLRPKGYLVVITNNIFADGRVYPLAYDTILSLTHDKKHPWVLKDEKIWLQDDKRLVALGVNYAWVGNRCHQYCLILRKESP